MIGLAKTKDDWMEYITNVDGEIEIVMNRMNLDSTNGLKNHVEITRLEINTNALNACLNAFKCALKMQFKNAFKKCI